MPFTSSQGTTFSFDGNDFQCTNIKVQQQDSKSSGGNSKIDISTLDLADGAERVYQDPPLVDPNAPVADEGGVQTTVTIEFFGNALPEVGVKGTLSTTGASGLFKCTQADQTYAVGELIKGTATFVSTTADGS